VLAILKYCQQGLQHRLQQDLFSSQDKVDKTLLSCNVQRTSCATHVHHALGHQRRHPEAIGAETSQIPSAEAEWALYPYAHHAL
jgi:hypothetical protein